jgi:hypothetical protein
VDDDEHWSILWFSGLPMAVPQQAGIGVHLKQTRFRGGDVEPPRNERGRESHGVSTLQERVRLKQRDTGFHG